MSDFNDIGRFYKQYEENKVRYPEIGLAYTCNCGWIDAGHANPFGSKRPNIGAANLWKNILNETDKYKQGAIDGYRIKYIQDAAAWGITFENAGDYFIRNNLSNIEKEKIALAIFQEVSLGFESVQGAGIKGFLSETFGTGSSYSGEDLVSNLVGFYHAVRGVRWQDWCGIVSRKAAEKVWTDGGTIGSAKNKNYGFLPKRHKCDECSDNTPFPSVYQSIYPISKGIWHFDFDEKNAHLILTPEGIEFRRHLFRGSSDLGFGFIFTPREVKLPIKEGENPYYFAHRALMTAAFQVKLPLFEQWDFADKFYPLTNSLKYISEFKLGVISDSSATDKNKDEKWDKKEFEKMKNTNMTYVLSSEEYDDLKAKREKHSFQPNKNDFRLRDK